MNVNELEQKVSLVVELLNTPFEEQVGEPAEITADSSLTNFLRSGPNRKIILLNDSYGDYEHDESMTTEVEISIGIENNSIYAATLELLKKEFGNPLPEPVESYDELPFTRISYEDSSDSNHTDGTDPEWTPEYEGGALFENTDDFVFEYWRENNQYIVLQNGKIWGDGDFTFYVLVAISKD